MAKPALGRGLSALLGGTASPAVEQAASPAATTPPWPGSTASGENPRSVPLSRVRPGPLQPRKDFSPESLQELAASIKEQGLIQPLIVREREGFLELIAGERRWRAAQLAGLAEVPVMVRHADDATALEVALVENLQRENLNPIEEAAGYRQLIEMFQLNQEEAAAKVGKNRAVVANALRLLNLPHQVQEWLRDGRVSVGHAKVVLGLSSGEQQTLACQRIVKDGLTVRQTEELVSHWLSRTGAPSGRTASPAQALQLRDAHVVALENKLRERFGTKVSLRYRQGKGAVEIRFFSEDELDRVLAIMGVSPD